MSLAEGAAAAKKKKKHTKKSTYGEEKSEVQCVKKQ